MSPHSGAAVALEPSSTEQAPDWVLAVWPTARMACSSIGIERAARGPLSSFFHGVLFDRTELARAVGLADADSSDAMLVLSAYARWGEAVLPRLRGAFALGLVDARQGVALLARDPLGSHPLFYQRGADGEVTCAGSPEVLARQGPSGLELNRSALADYVCHRWPEPADTFFRNVLRVLPGHRVRLSTEGLRVDRYWDPAPLDRPIKWTTHREAEQFDALLDRAVDRGLAGHQGGIFLSGGLDSISIAAVAADRARRAGRPVPHALSLGFPEAGCDERLVQTAVARQLGLPMRLLDFHDAVGPRGLLAQSIELNRRLPSPLLNTWAPAYLQLARRGVTAGVRTILTGSGGDEWLTVSPFLGADLLRRGEIGSFVRFVRAWKRSYRASSWLRFGRAAVWTYSLRPLAGAALHTLAPNAWDRRRRRRRMDGDPAWVAPDPTLRQDLEDRACRTLAPPDPPHGFYFQEVRTGLEHPVTSIELEEQYQFGQWLGVRFHHPYWDADLVDLLYRTPPRLLNQGGRSKGLVRDSLAKRFPALGFDRQRKVLATQYYRSVLLAEAPAIARTYGDCRTLDELGVVDGPRAQRMIGEALASGSGTTRQLHQAWDLLTLEAWARSRA